jgi:hypothetical protein
MYITIVPRAKEAFQHQLHHWWCIYFPSKGGTYIHHERFSYCWADPWALGALVVLISTARMKATLSRDLPYTACLNTSRVWRRLGGTPHLSHTTCFCFEHMFTIRCYTQTRGVGLIHQRMGKPRSIVLGRLRAGEHTIKWMTSG